MPSTRKAFVRPLSLALIPDGQRLDRRA